MAYSIDVLATTLQELREGFQETFLQWHPLDDYIFNKRGNVERASAKGHYIEFDVITGGPGYVSQVVNGDEVIKGGRRQNAKKGNTYAPFLFYAFDVPMKDLREANNKMDFARIIKRYPETALSEFAQYRANQFASGNGDNGMGGFVTLNGQKTYSPQGTALTGVFSFAAKASQTETVFGLVKEGGTSGVTGWYNQYGDISSFSSEGREKMRQVLEACERQGANFDGGLDLISSDTQFYLNYITDLDDQVRIPATGPDATKGGDRSSGLHRRGIKFMDADWYADAAIDLTVYTGVAADGVAFLLDTSTWHIYTIDGEKKGEDLTIGDPIRIPDQPVWRFEFQTYMGIYCDQLRRNGCVTGGATK